MRGGGWVSGGSHAGSRLGLDEWTSSFEVFGGCKISGGGGLGLD